jgi:hypothetical protein
MFERLEALLTNNPTLWSDGYLVFEYGPNTLSAADADALLTFFGPSKLVRPRSGDGTTELLVTPEVLKEIDISYGHLALAQMLRDEVRLFTGKAIDASALWDIVDSFFSALSNPRVFCNTSVEAVPLGTTFLGGWNPASKHTQDAFLCAVDRTRIAYWLTANDE